MIAISVTLKRKHTSKGADLAPYETIRTLAMRKSIERKEITDMSPHGLFQNEFEWVCICDEKTIKTFWDSEFLEMQIHYDVI